MERDIPFLKCACVVRFEPKEDEEEKKMASAKWEKRGEGEKKNRKGDSSMQNEGTNGGYVGTGMHVRS